MKNVRSLPTIGLVIRCALVAAVTLLIAAPASAIPNLVGHWQLEETNTGQAAVDSSGTNASGTYAAGVNPNILGPSGFGSAAQFFADGNNINIGSGTTLNLQSDFSVTGWVNFDTLTGKQSFIGNPSWAVRTAGTAPHITTFGVKDYVGTGGTLTTGEWHHMAVVVDSAFDATFYVNGNFAGTSTHNAPANSNTSDFAIGGRTVGSGFEAIAGRVDDVRVFSGALTQSEVQAIMSDFTSDIVQETIMPTSVTVNVGSEFFSADNLINGSGLSGTATFNNIETITHAGSGSGNSWVTDAAFPDYYTGGLPAPEMVFDLGDDFTLTDLVAWNYSVPGNAARQITAEFSSDGGLTFGSAVILEIPQLAGVGHILSFGDSIRADMVRITFDSNYTGFGAGGDRVGLNELKFVGSLTIVPEPATMSLLLIGGAALLRRKRRLA